MFPSCTPSPDMLDFLSYSQTLQAHSHIRIFAPIGVYAEGALPRFFHVCLFLVGLLTVRYHLIRETFPDSFSALAPGPPAKHRLLPAASSLVIDIYPLLHLSLSEVILIINIFTTLFTLNVTNMII